MDETISLHLFPRHPVFWIIWVVSILIVFPLYYINEDYYRSMSVQHEKDRWIECGSNGPCEELGVDVTGTWKVYVRQPRNVADFVESPVEIRLTNTTTTTQNAILTIEVKPQNSQVDRYVHYQVGELKQNFINVENVLAHGQASYEFMVKVLGGQDDDIYILDVRINDDPIRNGYTFADYPITFNRVMMLRLWAEAYLLSPPAANLVIPIILLLMVSMSQIFAFIGGQICESCLGFFVKAKCSAHIDKTSKNLQMAVSALFGLILLGVLAPVWSKSGDQIKPVIQVLPDMIMSLLTLIFWIIASIVFLWGVVEQSWKYKKHKDVQKVELVQPLEN
ncbi:MAG: hypothetical protein KC441_02970 [Anaerolineales bacterium]|nr:hypothetical protein [Anaerolineales bacterium]